MNAAAARIRIHQPWRRSTGPKTAGGKAVSRMNALKHGNRSAAVIHERRAIKHYLRVQKEFLKQIRLLLRYRRAGLSQKIIQKTTNELLQTFQNIIPLTLSPPHGGEGCKDLGHQPLAVAG